MGLVVSAVKNWKWFGNAGHFIAWRSCRFHLCTLVGKHIVSTVGDYHPSGSEKAETIGCDRLFETMVFEAGTVCKCGCGQPEIAGDELDFEGYNEVAAATEGHMRLCAKWAKKSGSKVSDR